MRGIVLILLLAIVVNGDDPSPSPTDGNEYKFSPGIGWHKFHTGALNWTEARDACKEEGAHLAIINSQAEADVLVKILKNFSHFEAFLGIHQTDEGWVTVLGDSLAKTGYTKWQYRFCLVGERNNHCGVLIERGGRLFNIKCKIVLPFFCELPTLQDSPMVLRKTN